MVLSSVLFPDPLWPTSATASPGAISSETCRSAQNISELRRWRKRFATASFRVETFSR